MFFKFIVFAVAVGIAHTAVVKVKDSDEKLRVKVTKITQCACDDTPNKIDLHIDVKDVSEDSSSFSGKATLPFDVDESVQLMLNVSKWKNDKWEPNVLSFKKEDPCKFVNSILGETWYKIQDRIKMPRGVCPIAKGTFEDKDLMIDLSTLEVPKVSGGVFQATSKLIKDGKIVLCMETDVKIW